MIGQEQRKTKLTRCLEDKIIRNCLLIKNEKLRIKNFGAKPIIIINRLNKISSIIFSLPKTLNDRTYLFAIYYNC